MYVNRPRLHTEMLTTFTDATLNLLIMVMYVQFYQLSLPLALTTSQDRGTVPEGTVTLKSKAN